VVNHTHVASIYRPAAGAPTLLQQAEGDSGRFTLVSSGNPCSLQIQDGNAHQNSGVYVRPRGKCYWNGLLDVRAEDRLLFTSGLGPPRWRVLGVNPRGGRWGTVTDLVESEEVHRVRFVRLVRTEARGGGGTVAREDGPEVWANVVPLSVREKTEAAASGQHVSHRVEVGYRADLAPYTEIRHQGRTLDIRGVLDVDERHVELHYTCEERQ
jgi:SPP1 family predicted phage head-tail adaptor